MSKEDAYIIRAQETGLPGLFASEEIVTFCPKEKVRLSAAATLINVMGSGVGMCRLDDPKVHQDPSFFLTSN